ncbi:putative GNAT family acetyltransferase [Paraburkholderia sp. GAS199]|uniref:GNAT family N-acetyltransferase n=1 Tax=Paraburkholderia sp. GAS199 TaxID=3035126 RepID=UPI003D1978C6
MTSSETTHPIDADLMLSNVIWNSLTGAHASAAEGSGEVRRYRSEFAPFAAARDYTPDNVAALARMLAPDERLTLFTLEKPVTPPGYDVVREASIIQMIGARRFEAPTDARIVTLDAGDAPDMLKLVERTDPGPFRQRTHELGTFVGIRVDGELVAMAGERMKAGSYVELSAVCTLPDWRGRGLGTLLMTHLAVAMQQRGETPFLHVLSGNLPALRLYEELGFQRARVFHLTSFAASVTTTATATASR